MNELVQNSMRVAADGLKELRPLFSRLSDEGRYTVSEPFRGRPTQIILCRPTGKWLATVKVEEVHTDNLYLEEWSDLDKVPGWMQTLKDDRCNCLIYYFRYKKGLEAGVAYVLPFPALWRWFYLDKNRERFRSTVPRLNQKNTTVGKIVPVSEIRSISGFAEYRGPKFTPPPSGQPKMF